tara:strand:- start:695 stop:6208 length:5514 start_codon:yes stop_codon:yes gene_type:complete
MPLNKLENFIKNTEGRILYVNPNDLDSTDAIENQGNSLTKPFKTIQRALLEAARFSWVKGNDNDIVEKTTILLYPGDHIVDNRPGFGIISESNVAKAVSPAGAKSNAQNTLTLTSSSNFDLTQEDNILYKFNSVYGGVVVPRGTSLVGLDLRKTKVRPKYVPNPTDDTLKQSTIFRITGGCYFWQFTTFDGDENTTVYTDNKDFTAANQATPTFSHHKLSIFEYADGINNPSGYDLTDLEQYYSKLSNAFNIASGRDVDQKYPAIPGGFSPKRAEYEIVGAFATDPIGITNIISGNGSTPGTVVTVTTSSAHGLNAGTPIKIRGVGVADYNISTVVTDISTSNDKEFTYALPLVRANLPASPSASSATVTIETDTVSGASPYIFNCSLRSVWGMNGLFADGANATGFRSVVAAQFTGVSLQKDDRAFVKYNPTSRTYNEITTTKVTGSALASGSSSTNADTVYHLDSDAIYKNDWETIHIKATNDAVMQLVSIFAIGYTRHFDVRTGSDYSLTNSNSNFGQLSLVSTGFKKKAFAKDDKGYITSIITPRAVTTAEESLDWQALDIEKTVQVGFSSHLYLYGYDSEDVVPPSVLQGYRVGARVNDLIYIDDNNTVPQTFSASIKMVDRLPSGGLATVSYGTNSSFKKYGVTNVASNVLTVGVHALVTGEKIKVVADDGDLPENLEAHKTYYAIVVDSTNIKLASSLTNANTNTPIIIYYSGSKLNVISRISDKTSGDLGHPIQWDSTNSQWYIHTDAGNAIYSTFVSQGVIGFGTATTKPSYIKRVEDTRSLDEKLYKLRVVIPKEFDNTKNPEEGFIIQESSNTGFRSDTDSALANSTLTSAILDGEDYDYNRNPRFISKCTEASSTVTVISEQPHGLNAWDQIIVKNVTSNGNVTGAGNSGYNGTFKVTGITDDKTFTYSTTDVNGIVHTTGSALTNDITSRTTSLPRFERNDCQDNFYIYRNEVITPYNKDIQDGVYHLYVLNAGNKVGLAFTNVGYSQNVTDLYPQQDKDNPDANPNASKTYASRSPLGEVTTDDLRNSLTRESIDKFLTNFHIGNTVTGVTTSFATSTKGTATLTFARNHNLSGIVTATIASGGSGYTNGTYQNVKVFDNNSSVWDGALARVVVAGGAVTNVDITSGGSGYGAENLDLDLTTSGTAADITTTLSGISTVIGNTVQVTGIGTTAGGHYRITSLPQRNQVAIGISNLDPSISTGQYLINVGHEIRVGSTSYNATTDIETINTAKPHGLSAGNKVSLVDANNGTIGEYLVRSAGLGTNTFTVSSETNVPTATYVLKHGLSDNDKSSDDEGENLGARGFYFYGNERYTLVTALTTASTNIKLKLHGVDGSTVSRFELGSYIQVDDEIMRITSNKLSGSGSDEVFVIRGSLGTLQQTHAAGSLIKKITPKPIEFRRPSIIRASGHTFEYIGYGPGNYSTGLPQVQVKTLSEKEDYLAQAQERDCGTVVYTGMNSKGDFIIGNKKINSATGQEKTFDIPVPTVTGQDPSRLSVVFDEVIIKERLLVEGGNSNTILSEFDGPVNFSQNVKVNGDLTVKGRIKQSSVLIITNLTQSNDIDEGALQVYGGTGIKKNLNVGGTLTGTGATFTGNVKAVAGEFSGALSGTTGTFTSNVTVGGTLTSTGDFTSSGGTFGNIQVGITGDNEIDTSSGNLTIDSTGGTTTIDDNVSVSGTLNVTSTGTFGGAIDVGGNVVASGVLDINGSGTNSISGPLDVGGTIRAINADIIAYATSDENLKENIVAIPDALSKVISISGNTYTWKEGGEHTGDDTGVIAQEVEALGLPGTVVTRDDGTKAVRYEKLIPVLIEAIKELSAKVDDLS